MGDGREASNDSWGVYQEVGKFLNLVRVMGTGDMGEFSCAVYLGDAVVETRNVDMGRVDLSESLVHAASEVYSRSTGCREDTWAYLRSLIGVLPGDSSKFEALVTHLGNECAMDGTMDEMTASNE